MNKSRIYTSSNTDDLYVLALKDGQNVRIKVKDLSCHSGIILNSGSGDSLSISSTFYSSYDELYNDFKKNKLNSNTIFIVNDKGTLEQYIIHNNSIIPIGGGVNTITEGVEDDKNEISLTARDNDGIIDYNMPELVNR
jgi:hypothetical protein